MKHLLTLLLLVCLGASSCDTEKASSKKVSPAKTAELKLNEAKLSVKYSSPQKRSREIWGKLVPYGEIWRTGADEATVFETSKKIYIGNDSLPAGKYSLFTVPQEDEWTIILNQEWDQWGAFNYNESKDIMRFKVSPQNVERDLEGMTISLLEETDTTGELKLAWGQLQVAVGFSVPASGPEES